MNNILSRLSTTRKYLIIFIAHLMTFIEMDGARVTARTGGHRESGEKGESREEETQWRQVITLYTGILRTFAGSDYFVMS